MAGRTLKHAGHRLLMPVAAQLPPTSAEEFEEADVWGYGSEAWERRKPSVSGRRKGEKRAGGTVSTAAASVPVNIPDWAKILRQEYRGHGRAWEEAAEEGEEGEGEDEFVPPHELLCRSRAASLSVHEGVGRTLKGRDLSRVRNAIWEKTGFQD